MAGADRQRGQSLTGAARGLLKGRTGSVAPNNPNAQTKPATRSVGHILAAPLGTSDPVHLWQLLEEPQWHCPIRSMYLLQPQPTPVWPIFSAAVEPLRQKAFDAHIPHWVEHSRNIS